IRVAYTPMKFTGSGKVNESYSFGKIIVNAKDRIDAKLRANQVDLTLAYDIPFVQTATREKLNIDAGANVKIIDGYLRVNDETRNEEDSKSRTIPVPMAYVSGCFKPVNFASISASGNWIGYSGNQFYDVSGEAKVYPLMMTNSKASSLFVGAGYRYQRLKIDDVSDVSSDVKVKGPFVEAGFEF
ncbi:MAG: TIGR04219 family outer membrane beta-barrel protein, partial [Nitrospiraceae bacterium]|nr:TIGR04219 family outer membrane beta-barrel protein [Nitrospiraceae bacterium]